MPGTTTEYRLRQFERRFKERVAGARKGRGAESERICSICPFSFESPGAWSVLRQGNIYMAFFSASIDVLQTLVIALGAGLGVWGGINLLEGYGNDNPGAKSQGIKQLMAGGGVALIGTTLVPILKTLFG